VERLGQLHGYQQSNRECIATDDAPTINEALLDRLVSRLNACI
jgi:hypothetical protein